MQVLLSQMLCSKRLCLSSNVAELRTREGGFIRVRIGIFDLPLCTHRLGTKGRQLLSLASPPYAVSRDTTCLGKEVKISSF